MHVRVTTRRRKDKVYRSVQIVQSYRRPDGMPAQKVLASFGNLSEVETENLKLAVKAGREGKAVVVGEEVARAARSIRANLDYLDVAVMWDAWQRWELSELIDELAPDTDVEVSVGDVVGALAVHRCVSPDSKLAASRWFSETALPELLGMPPARFNNTRIHRTLDVLDDITTALQARLARRIEARQGPLHCLFLDCTDTWFVGRGPDMASNGPTKEGLFRMRVGIALLCDQHGFPLRWKTLSGNHDERRSMFQMIREVAEQGWAQDIPFVVDRAMGRGATICDMVRHGLRFITAAPSHEFSSWSPDLPLGAFDSVPLGGSPTESLDALRDRALDLGFRSVRPDRLVRDLGVLTKASGASRFAERPTRGQAVLRMARALASEAEAEPLTQKEQGARWGLSARQVRRLLEVLALADEVQERVLAGEGAMLIRDDLAALARLPASEQPSGFDRACEERRDQPPKYATPAMMEQLGSSAVEARAVLVFHPQRFVEQRRKAEAMLAALREGITEINRSLRSAASRATELDAHARAHGLLRKASVTDVFDIEVHSVEHHGKLRPQVELVTDEAAWQRRRASDGLALLLSFAEYDGTAVELTDTYFAKDRVEKDFQIIKSAIKLRPVRHWTDPKVRAHITLCMLALLLERDIERRLAEAGSPSTAKSALESLRTGKLNVFADERGLYSPTLPRPNQQAILTALGLKRLVDEEAVAETLTPR